MTGDTGAGDTGTGRPSAQIVRAGALTTVQDRGRPGFGHLGVPPSGALDRRAHALANRLVGNDEDAATLETTGDGVALRVERASVVAVTGAAAPVRVDGRPARWNLPVHLGIGSLLEVGTAEVGVRCYVAISGGFDAPRTLGSRSTDLLSGLGPPPLRDGQRLALGPRAAVAPVVDLTPHLLSNGDLVLPLHPGPRRDWLAATATERLFAQRYRLSPASNRVALRLVGHPIERARRDELPSEGIVWGAVQLLGNGELLVFLADHPTTGGYPVVAVVDPAAAAECAQARPGAAVALRPAPRRSGGGRW